MSSVYHIGLPFTVSRTSTVVRYRLPPSSGGHEEKVLDRRLQDLKTKTSQDMLSLARRAHETAVTLWRLCFISTGHCVVYVVYVSTPVGSTVKRYTPGTPGPLREPLSFYVDEGVWDGSGVMLVATTDTAPSATLKSITLTHALSCGIPNIDPRPLPIATASTALLKVL